MAFLENAGCWLADVPGYCTSIGLESIDDLRCLFNTAEEAIATLRSQPFDAALLDINYGGGMDGFDAIRAIRADPQLASIPAAALTAHVAPEDRDQCLRAGFDLFLAKPVRRAEMTDAIGMLLQKRTTAGVSRA